MFKDLFFIFGATVMLTFAFAMGMEQSTKLSTYDAPKPYLIVCSDGASHECYKAYDVFLKYNNEHNYGRFHFISRGEWSTLTDEYTAIHHSLGADAVVTIGYE